MQNSYTAVNIAHKIVKLIKKIWQSYSPVLLIFSISVPNVVTIGRRTSCNVICDVCDV